MRKGTPYLVADEADPSRKQKVLINIYVKKID